MTTQRKPRRKRAKFHVGQRVKYRLMLCDETFTRYGPWKYSRIVKLFSEKIVLLEGALYVSADILRPAHA